MSDPLTRDATAINESKNMNIKIKDIEVQIEWGNGSASDSIGVATHTVTEEQMEAGYGPVDGEQFSVDGKNYNLGQHEYETSGNNVTCWANIYEVGK